MATGSLVETLYASTAAGATLASFTSEAQLNTTATMGGQFYLPAGYFTASPTSVGRGFRVIARGILSSTGTPTYTLTIRSGTAGNTSAAIVLGTAALTTASSASNQMWEMVGDIIVTAIGAAGANSTVRGTGHVISAGLNPVVAAAFGGAASPGTVATFDHSIANYINVNVACSASNASNTITLHELMVQGLN